MNIIQAYKYIKPFVFGGNKIIPSENYFKFIVYIDEQSYLIISKENEGHSLRRIYNFDKKILINTNIDEVSHLPGFELDVFCKAIESIYKIKDDYIFTSDGFIDIDTFYLAKDIYEDFYFLKKRDIKENYIYKTILGDELVYIKDQHRIYKDQFFNASKKVVYNRSSSKIIEEIGEISKEKQYQDILIYLP